jgi:hypothetical protein
MRPSTEHHRKLIAFLRDIYQVNDVRLVSGRKCPKLAFQYGGKSFVVSVSARTAEDFRAANNHRTALRRLLGPPPATEKRPRRTLAEITAEVAVRR